MRVEQHLVGLQQIGAQEEGLTVAEFIALHPELRIEMMLGDRPRDLVRDAVDVAIRLGRLVEGAKLFRENPGPGEHDLVNGFNAQMVELFRS
jgi:hypothetical protein